MDKLIKKALNFRDKRDWKQFHTPRNLAESLVLEASEVLEKFQWKKDDKLSKVEVRELEQELADVFIYLIYMAYSLDIDLMKAANRKMTINSKKYPVRKSKGRSTKYTKL